MRYALKEIETGNIVFAHEGDGKFSVPEGYELVGQVPEEIEGKDCKFLKEDAGVISIDEDVKLQKSRDEKLQALREARNLLIAPVDIMINIKIDAVEDYSALSTYRASLRDITESYKTDSVANDQCDSLDLDTFIWPVLA